MFEKNSITENREDTIQSVLDNVRVGEPSERFPGAEIRIFTYGMKELTLAVKRKNHELLTFVENKLPEEARRPDEKHVLYEAALKLMRQIVDAEEIPYEYRILTENQKIKDWAVSKGREIFKWSNIDEDELLFVATKVISPMKNKQ